jgi:ABC-type sugar transport system ATPase subunit
MISADDTTDFSHRPLLELNRLAKRFGGVRALSDANLTITGAGVVHGLIGENGSGKSTLLGVLSGQLRPDAGDIHLDGREVVFTEPLDAIRHGIAMVSQETAIAPDLSVAENIFLGHRMTRTRVGIDWPATRDRAAEILERLALDIDPGHRAGSLSPDRQQMVEIARALSMDARVLILDEPTSSLTDDEVEALFSAVRSLTTQGVSVIFVSHRLTELFDLCDELTVLRDGRTTAAGPVGEFDVHSLVDAMVGGNGAWRESARSMQGGADDAASGPAVSVQSLAVPGVLHDITFDVQPGEIVGLAGLLGAGRSELLEAIFGLRPLVSGEVRLFGDPHAPASPRDAIARGLGYLPPDRKEAGLVLGRTVAENLAMVATSGAGRLRSPHGRGTGDIVAEVMASMHVRAPSPHVSVGTLSGGNQQKVALGKWIAAGSRLLLLDEPTRGVDVAAKAEIHQLLRATAANGVALLVSSSENDELLQLCDRIFVLYRGRIVASLSATDASEALLGRYAGGHVSV